MMTLDGVLRRMLECTKRRGMVFAMPALAPFLFFPKCARLVPSVNRLGGKPFGTESENACTSPSSPQRNAREKSCNAQGRYSNSRVSFLSVFPLLT